jgi:general stress protein 26
MPETDAMEHVLSDAEKREKLHEILGGFDTAMLVTRTLDGVLRSRPLSIARKKDDDRLYFSTGIDTGKVSELESDAHVNVSMQSRTKFASVSGHARLSRERALVEELWSEAWRMEDLVSRRQGRSNAGHRNCRARGSGLLGRGRDDGAALLFREREGICQRRTASIGR